jgi:hypothetical protein
MVYLRAERVFILKHYFASKSSAAVRQAFIIAYPDREVPNKTIHWLVTQFRHTGSVCVTSAHRAMKHLNFRPYRFQAVYQLQQFNTAIGFVVLCVKKFVCSSYCCVLNGAYCTFTSRSFQWQMAYPVARMFTNHRHIHGSVFTSVQLIFPSSIILPVRTYTSELHKISKNAFKIRALQLEMPSAE